jgi:hypothetical protein
MSSSSNFNYILKDVSNNSAIIFKNPNDMSSNNSDWSSYINEPFASKPKSTLLYGISGESYIIKTADISGIQVPFIGYTNNTMSFFDELDNPIYLFGINSETNMRDLGIIPK